MSDFVFQSPIVLLALLLSIPLIYLLAFARKKRIQLIQAMGGARPSHSKRRDALRLTAYCLLILALARPGYAPQAESIARTGRDVVFALDVSQSMLAEDIQPSRLAAAKQAVRDALQTFSNERVGLLVYAGSASILCPLTYDYDFVRYMLEQANPRTVDFGGTTLQAAVEKAVDQIFISGRAELQDLVVLTDGGDHGSTMSQTVDLLNDQGVDTLLLGLGNPHAGSPIKLTDDTGQVTLLEYQEQVVYSKLDDAALRKLAALSPRIDYLPLATQVFNLGQVYLDYVQHKPIDAADAASGHVVYQEAALFFILAACLLLLAAEAGTVTGIKLSLAVIYAAGVMPSAYTQAQELQHTEATFSTALNFMHSAQYQQAADCWQELYHSASQPDTPLNQLARLQFNRGLALVALSDAQQEPAVALSYSQQAQQAFLSAKRYDQKLARASLRLQITATRMTQLQSEVAQQQAQTEQIEQQMQMLLTQLQSLLEAQSKLRQQVTEASSQAQHTADWIRNQNELRQRARASQNLMQQIDSQQKLLLAQLDPADSAMTQPLELIAQAQDFQRSAAAHFADDNTSQVSLELQIAAEHSIQQIIDLLAGDSQQEPTEGDEWEEQEDYEFDYSDEISESNSSSESMPGDLAAGSEMQPLPVPNYSAKDILLQEQGSQQFRQNKRANSNAAQVDKDF